MKNRMTYHEQRETQRKWGRMSDGPGIERSVDISSGEKGGKI